MPHTVISIVSTSLWNFRHRLRPHDSSSWRRFHSGGSMVYIFRYLLFYDKTCLTALHFIINVACTTLLCSISGDFKNRFRYLNMQKYGPTTGGLGDLKTDKTRVKFGVQLLKCWNILWHIFANVFVSNFRNVRLAEKALWSPAVALKFYVTCTVFNDLN